MTFRRVRLGVTRSVGADAFQRRVPPRRTLRQRDPMPQQTAHKSIAPDRDQRFRERSVCHRGKR